MSYGLSVEFWLYSFYSGKIKTRRTSEGIELVSVEVPTVRTTEEEESVGVNFKIG